MSRNPSSSSSGSGRSASVKGGTSAGGRAGSSAGSRMGTGVGAPLDPGPPPRHNLGVVPVGAVYARPRPRPMLMVLAGVGWATFALEWLVVLVVIMQMGANSHNAVATAPPTAAPPAPRPTAPVTPVTPTPPAARPTPTPAPAPAPAGVAANVLGLPLGAGQTAVLLDAIDSTAGYLTDAKAALIRGLSQPAAQPNTTFRLLAIRDGKATDMTDRGVAPGPDQANALRRFLNPLTAEGKGGLSSGIDAAIATKPAAIVFITARTSGWDGYVGTLERKLEAGGRRIVFHVVQVGEPVPSLRAFVTGANGGTYQQMTEAQVKALAR